MAADLLCRFRSTLGVLLRLICAVRGVPRFRLTSTSHLCGIRSNCACHARAQAGCAGKKESEPSRTGSTTCTRATFCAKILIHFRDSPLEHRILNREMICIVGVLQTQRAASKGCSSPAAPRGGSTWISTSLPFVSVMRRSFNASKDAARTNKSPPGDSGAHTNVVLPSGKRLIGLRSI